MFHSSFYDTSIPAWRFIMRRQHGMCFIRFNSVDIHNVRHETLSTRPTALWVLIKLRGLQRAWVGAKNRLKFFFFGVCTENLTSASLLPNNLTIERYVRWTAKSTRLCFEICRIYGIVKSLQEQRRKPENSFTQKPFNSGHKFRSISTRSFDQRGERGRSQST